MASLNRLFIFIQLEGVVSWKLFGWL